ncbi:phage holin family protein [Morganella sp. EGD-HP17]|uniref:phage holin family protein n=1 Tax=Morganella sp. EGD-HP17 TaxID=1435146 RepID=UPI00040A4513|nr:phage holin family protein [Morganella sp. EGD-HP17]ETO41471.1 holin [Morganella sp. EGD-HP17]
MRMPDKFDWWAQILRWLQNATPLLGGFSVATIIAYIRERRDGSRWKQSLGEAVICGLLSVGTIRFMDWWLLRSGDTGSWGLLAEFCGAMIGFLGTRKLYVLLELAAKVIKNKLGVKDD